MAILREEAEPLPTNVPAPLRWIIERLLAKEPAERYDSTRDLYRELRQVRDRLSESVSGRTLPAPARQSKKRLLPGIGLLTAGLALNLGLAALLIRPAPPDLAAYKFTPISRDEATERYPVWSPDGKSIAYTAICMASTRSSPKLWARPTPRNSRMQPTPVPNPCGRPIAQPSTTFPTAICGR
jgi:eukaryotic-like serine/threonine-protein kinase